MPAQPLIDFEKLDLARPSFGLDEVRKYCKQRGRFEMLDGIVRFDANDPVCVGFKDVRADAWWAADHIPGRPIFPGALQCEGAAQLATYDFLKRRGRDDDLFLGFAGMDSVRFRGLVAPPARLVLAVRLLKARGPVFIYDAQAFVERRLVFEGQIIGSAV
ncbi:MAG: beta-hydroxyacyl-ACP dehydratase [Planctomycetes bacterium]|nr:beta-hydroxyacyl-ACP dehydratase [Planctomycetota bacterium]